MKTMENEDVNTHLFCRLIEVAVRNGNYHSDELGRNVRIIANMALSKPEFVRYTDDWKAEMFSNACFAMFEAMKNVDLSNESGVFNYMYTTATNCYKKSVLKLKKENERRLSVVMENGEEIDPFYLRNKRKVLRGFLEKKEDSILKEAASRKQALLSNSVGRVVRKVTESFDSKSLTKLLEKSRKIRESANAGV